MLTKKQQLYKNKEPKISSIEKEYLNYLQTLNARCWLCKNPFDVEWHHIKLKSTDKKDHKRLIPLCKKHHTGNELSPHGTPTKWRETYSIQEQNRWADIYYKEFLEQR